MNLLRTMAEVDMNSVLNNGMSLGERLADGGKMILMVMAWVFSVIFLVWLMQTLFTAGIVAVTSKKSKKDEITEPVVAEEPLEETDDSEVTVAVITAAIAAYLQAESEDGTVPAFRVVSFKRKNAGKPWNSKN